VSAAARVFLIEGKEEDRRMIWGIMTAVVVIAAYIVYRIVPRPKAKRTASNVIKMPINRGDKQHRSQQKCSLCHQRSKRLSFYASEEGTPIGVCDKCRPIAERRALLRL
jgi:hypothetical protein